MSRVHARNSISDRGRSIRAQISPQAFGKFFEDSHPAVDRSPDTLLGGNLALYLVIGGAGFIGSALVRELLPRGERVRVVDNFLTGKRENLAEVADRIDLCEVDITNLERLRPALEGVDYVLHEAALPSVPRSIERTPSPAIA